MSKPFYGIGFNSGGKHKTCEQGKHTKAYKSWYNMLTRSYSHDLHLKNPTYIGCAVADEWHDFQDFAEWFYNHKYSGVGYCLDKDLLFAGNKVYSPDACCFVPQELNKILCDSNAVRGEHPQGVHFRKSKGTYMAYININGKRKQLGTFNCPDKAYRVYVKEKENYVNAAALEWRGRIADNVFQALMSWKLTS